MKVKLAIMSFSFISFYQLAYADSKWEEVEIDNIGDFNVECDYRVKGSAFNGVLKSGQVSSKYINFYVSGIHPVYLDSDNKKTICIDSQFMDLRNEINTENTKQGSPECVEYSSVLSLEKLCE